MNLNTLTTEEFLTRLLDGHIDLKNFDPKALADKIRNALNKSYEEGYEDGYIKGEKDHEDYNHEVIVKLEAKVDDLREELAHASRDWDTLSEEHDDLKKDFEDKLNSVIEIQKRWEQL